MKHPLIPLPGRPRAKGPSRAKLAKLFVGADGTSYLRVFILICTLFLLWGFSMGLIDVLNKHFQDTLHISKAKSAYVQLAYYLGYFLMAIPAGLLAKRFGYKAGIVTGLVLVLAGAIWAIPATHSGVYALFLAGLFVLACGLSILETVANPYATVLGPHETGSTRINMAQSCNAVGQLAGPLIGGHFILSSTVAGHAADSTPSTPYIGIAVIVAVLVIVFFFSKVPDVSAFEDPRPEADAGAGSSPGKPRPLWKEWHYVFAIVAQFFYMVAQTGIYAFFINYTVSSLKGTTPQRASVYLSLGGFGMFLIGRLVGSYVVKRVRPSHAVAFYGAANVALVAVVVVAEGEIGMAALIGTFFFMSIMYPTIFALGIFGLGERTKRASSFIVMTLVGGAFTPFMGYVADLTNIAIGYVVPGACFAVVALYGLFWKRLRERDLRTAAAAA